MLALCRDNHRDRSSPIHLDNRASYSRQQNHFGNALRQLARTRQRATTSIAWRAAKKMELLAHLALPFRQHDVMGTICVTKFRRVRRRGERGQIGRDANLRSAGPARFWFKNFIHTSISGRPGGWRTPAVSFFSARTPLTAMPAFSACLIGVNSGSIFTQSGWNFASS